MSKDVTCSREGALLTVTLNRADCGNLVTMEMVDALREALAGVPREVKLVVLAGAGNDFCKGRDYQSAPESAQGGRAPSALTIRDEMTSPIATLYGALKELAVPTLAVVQGAAYGFGCALSGACDLVVAGERARFRLPEMKRGLPPTLAMTALLDRVSLRGVAHLVYSTAELDARQAQAIGLVSAVHADERLQEEVRSLIDTISLQPVDAVRAVKEYLRVAPAMEPRGRSDFGANLFANVLSSR